jgi:UDP-N-acetylglucosamine 4,6-dehydratase
MFVAGKTICITGGTGSLGTALVDNLLGTDCEKIIIFSRDEYKQHVMRLRYNNPRLRFFIGDIRDEERLKRAFHGVDYVIHAAALKQADIIDYNYQEAIKTNINGTSNVMNVAIDNSVKRVLFVSSDKAVEPVNLYGATKLVGEQIVKSGNIYSAGWTNFSIFRSGNFINSRGSFTEKLWRLHYMGIKDVPLISDDMERYFISLGDAAKSAINALFSWDNITVPFMYKMSIKNVAKAIIPDCTFIPYERFGNEKVTEKLWQCDEDNQNRQLEGTPPEGYFNEYKLME